MKVKPYLFVLFFSSIIWSCRKHEKPTTLSVSQTILQLGMVTGHSDSFTVESDINWKLAIEPATAGSWLQVSATTGTPGKTIVRLTSLNAITTTQTATLRITPDGTASSPSATVSVTRKVYELDWQKTFGGSGYDVASSTIRTADGGYVFCGTSSSQDWGTNTSKGAFDMVIVKLDASGNQQWKTTVGGALSESGSGIAATNDGGYIAIGETNSTDNVEELGTSQGDYDMLVVKLDASGNRQWSKRYGGSGNDLAFNVLALTEGGFIVRGYTNSSQSPNGDIGITKGGYDVWIMKLDASGNRVWTKTFGSSDFDYPQSAVLTSDGGLLLLAEAGKTGDGDVPAGHAGADMWLLKLDGAGNIQWNKTYGGDGYDGGYMLAAATDGNFVICGTTSSNANGDIPETNGQLDGWVMKINAQGNKLWSKTFGGNQFDEFIGITANADGSFLLAGDTDSNEHGDVPLTRGSNDLWLMKLDAGGSMMWNKALGGVEGDYAFNILSFPDGSFTVVANTYSNNSFDVPATKGSSDIWFLKFK